MARQTINIGTIANDGTGDPIRLAFSKINSNFTELYASIGQNIELTQSDWNESDINSLAYIKNKPSIPTDLSHLTDTTNLLSGSASYNQDLNTTDSVSFNGVAITGSGGIVNADGQRITNTYYNGTLLVGSNMTQTPVSILMGGAGPRNEWKFTPDGNLTLPENGDILDSNGVSVLSNSTNTGDFTFNGNILSTDVGMSLSMNSGNLDIAVGNKTYSFVNDSQYSINYLQIPGFIQGGLQTSFISSNGYGIRIDGYNSPHTVDIGSLSSGNMLRITDGAGDVIIQSLGSSFKTQVGNSATWEFKGNGDLNMPNGLTMLGGAPVLSVETGNNFGISTSRMQTASAAAWAGGIGVVFDISENDDITVVQPGWTVMVNGVTYTVDQVTTNNQQVPPIYAIAVTPEPTEITFNQGTTYTFFNPTPISSTWLVGNDGTITTPGSGTISHTNNDLKIEVSGTDVIVFRTDGGDLVIPSSGGIQFNDGTTQTTAYTQAQYDYLIDGTNTPWEVSVVNMSAINVHPATGYSGNETHVVILPAGTPSQRLVVVNQSSSSFISVVYGMSSYTINKLTVAEFIYISGNYGNKWIPLYGTI